jgi:hypothetical protein
MKYLWLLVSILLLASPSLALLPPVADPQILVSGDVNFFFWNDSSTYGSGYSKLSTYPQLQDTTTFSVDISQSTGPKTIASFITDPFPNGIVMAPGMTRFRPFLNVSSDVGLTTFEFITYNVSTSGVENKMWYGVARTIDISSLTPTEYLSSYSRRNYTYFLPGERLLLRVNASTTSVASRKAYISVAGTGTASMATMGYWLNPYATTNPTNGNESFAYSPTGATPMPVWFIFVFGALLFFAGSFLFKPRYADGKVSSERIVFSLLSTVACAVCAIASLEIVSPSGVAVSIVYQQPVITILFVVLSILSFANFVYSAMKSDIIVPDDNYDVGVDSKVKAERRKK